MSNQTQAIGKTTGALPDGLVPGLAQTIAEHGYPVAQETAGLVVSAPEGRLEARLDEDGLTVTIGAAGSAELHMIREAFLHVLDDAAPGVSGRMRWEGDVAKTAYPPNFRKARFVAAEPVSRNFLRVTLEADKVEDFREGGMHFRLALPPQGREPIWPRLDEAGRTQWPKGDDALHNPAYTFVAIEPDECRFSFDLFVHEGGLATRWAQTAQVGDVVGIMGPGGGKPPESDFLLIAGDETALPAIRRILELSPTDRHGHVFLEIGDPGDRMPLAAPSGMNVEWLQRGEGSGLWDRLSAIDLPPAGSSRFVWIAAERTLATKARRHFRDHLRLTARESYISAYWTA